MSLLRFYNKTISQRLLESSELKLDSAIQDALIVVTVQAQINVNHYNLHSITYSANAVSVSLQYNQNNSNDYLSLAATRKD